MLVLFAIFVFLFENDTSIPKDMSWRVNCVWGGNITHAHRHVSCVWKRKWLVCGFSVLMCDDL